MNERIFFKKTILALCLLGLVCTDTYAQSDAKPATPLKQELRTAKGKTTKIPYSEMALTAKYLGPALADPN